MKNILILALFASLLIISCRKDSSDGSDGNLLAKIVGTSAYGNQTTEFYYDASNRLTRELVSEIYSGTDYSSDRKISRNETGLITRITTTGAQITQAGADSVIVNVFSNINSGRYNYTLELITTLGRYGLDSNVYIYDASDKIIAVNNYSRIPGQTDYVITGKYEYDYDANNNVTRYSIFSLDPNNTSSFVLSAVFNYLYDDKKNPLPLGNDAIIISINTMSGVNNAAEYDFESITSPSNSYNFKDEYTYNASNKPATCISTLSQGNKVQNNRYYYR